MRLNLSRQGLVPFVVACAMFMQNLDGAYGMARRNILDNCAVAADMPAEIINSETFAEGFGEGSEDAKRVARWVDRFRVSMNPLYDWLTAIAQHPAVIGLMASCSRGFRSCL